MRVLRSPVVPFLTAAILAAFLVFIATAELSQRAAVRAAIREAGQTTNLLAMSVAEPALPRGLIKGNAGAIDRFDREVVSRLLVGDVKRIKILDGEGRILYSDETRLINSQHDLDEDQVALLETGGTEAELEDLSQADNRFDRRLGEVVEVYTRIKTPEGEFLLFEAYISSAAVADSEKEILGAFRPIALGGLLLLVLCTAPLLFVMMRRLDHASRDREALLHSAVAASDSERRRIARDLHDGVVQDLAGTSFALSALVREASTYPPGVQPKLAEMSASLRNGLRSLRSLLVEIYPPDLHAAGLAAALEDLVAPSATVGIVATLSVDDVSDVSEDVVALVWRVAQEAVRNVFRHSSARSLQLRLVRQGNQLLLEVVDDGVGFDVSAATKKGHFGLRGLQDLIRDVGGDLQVRSSKGRGTTVTLEVKIR